MIRATFPEHWPKPHSEAPLPRLAGGGAGAPYVGANPARDGAFHTTASSLHILMQTSPVPHD